MTDRQQALLISTIGVTLTAISIAITYIAYREGKELRRIQTELAKVQLEKVKPETVNTDAK